jgi:hypothetical protein
MHDTARASLMLASLGKSLDAGAGRDPVSFDASEQISR